MRSAWSGLDRFNNTLICGRKCCTGCGRWRHLSDFHSRSRTASGATLAWQSRCMACQRIAGRRNKGLRKRGRPYEPRSPRPPQTIEERRARQRAYYRKRRKDPVWVTQRQEYERFYTEAKRRAAGIPARPRKRKAPRSTFTFLPPDPLLALLTDHIVAERANGSPEYGWEDVARASEIPPRSFWRWRYEGSRIRIDKADTIAVVVLGVPLSLIYPEA